MPDPRLRRLRRIELTLRREAANGATRPLAEQFPDDPLGYCKHVLGVELTQQQQEILQALVQPPYRVLVRASHNTGKSFCAACAISWWFDSFNPGLVLTTAPTDQSVRDVLWREVRILRERAHLGGFRGPKMPRLETSADHWAHGFTTQDGESFQGRHAEHILIVFDESVGVEPIFWETAKTMFAGRGHAWLCIHNPTDTTSTAYLEEHLTDMQGCPLWRTIRMSATEHPNIMAELKGDSVRYPSAIRLARFEEMLHEWCSPVPEGERKARDIEWRPSSGNYLRPGPLAEARLLGLWPSQGTYGIWSDALWQEAITRQLEIPRHEIPRGGCDVARFGDDFTCIHIRIGPVSVHHESVNGWSTSQIAGRLKRLACEWATWFNSRMPDTRVKLQPEEIPFMIDADGVGGGVIDQAGGFYFVPVSGAGTPGRPADYPNIRSELWFQTAKRAEDGRLSLARLPRDVLTRLRMQVMAPSWKLDSAGRRVVEKKEDTKKAIGRSPDDADAMNLAFFERDFAVSSFGPEDIQKHEAEQDSGRDWDDHRPIWERARDRDYQSAQERRGLFGYGSGFIRYD